MAHEVLSLREIPNKGKYVFVQEPPALLVGGMDERHDNILGSRNRHSVVSAGLIVRGGITIRVIDKGSDTLDIPAGQGQRVEDFIKTLAP